MRINKFLAESGIASRRQCDKLIEEGKVTINGSLCTLGQEVTEKDSVKVDGVLVRPQEKKEYYMMNKPKGYVSTVKDDKDRPTVMDLLPAGAGRVFPVGRLDYDSEGMLIFTNDGEMTFRLTHPKNEVPKTYLIRIEGIISDLALGKLRGGVEIDGVRTKKCNVKVVEEQDSYTKMHITITEGRNRQVRKMLEAVGKEVIFLKRIKIGELTLKGLDRGKVRKLTAEEIEYLRNV
jgi:23S rRNA pseudouridine2605 synthase